MNVLFLSMTFPDAGQPVRGTFNAALCRALAQRHHIRAIVPRGWPEWMTQLLRGRPIQPTEGVRAAGIRVEYPPFWYPPGCCRNIYGRLMVRSIRGALRETTDGWRPDAVLSYWAHPDGEAGLHVARELGIPAAVIIGGSDVLLLPRDPRRRESVRRVLCESDRVITVSEGLRRACLDLGAAPERVQTIPQGIDTSLFSPGDRSEARRVLDLPQDQPVFVWVGRMVEVKGLDVLLEAAATLHRRLDFRLCLVGDGPLRGALRNQAARAGLWDVVRFVGPVGPENLAPWYRAADATVVSSRSEGLPNVLRESLACGTPFVSTDVGSIAEIADKHYARLVPAGNAGALADALVDILEPRSAVAARMYIPRTWHACAEDIASLLCTLANDRQEAPRGENPPVPLADERRPSHASI